VFRAILGFIFFTAAYLAEDIRGGLNTLEKGQEEAAFALGLSYVQSLRYIVLPQAIRSVIPVIVGRFISVFKDSSLVAIVGLLDLLGMAQSILANPKFLGLQKEVYLFIALVYWLVAIFMSIFSERLETVLGNCEGE
jgi:general L-amino acid transport system permease protein